MSLRPGRDDPDDIRFEQRRERHSQHLDDQLDYAREALCAEIVKRIRAEILPKIDLRPDAGYDCCGCSSYGQIVNDVLDLIADVQA